MEQRSRSKTKIFERNTAILPRRDTEIQEKKSNNITMAALSNPNPNPNTDNDHDESLPSDNKSLSLDEDDTSDTGIVTWNVGGEVFCTRRRTVYQYGPNYLTALLDRKFTNPTFQGKIFIDRDKVHFRRIMLYFRGYHDELLSLSERDKLALIDECKFYGIDGLIELLYPTLPPEKQKAYVDSICHMVQSVKAMLPPPFGDLLRQSLDDDTVRKLCDEFTNTLAGRERIAQREGKSEIPTSAGFMQSLLMLYIKVMLSAVTSVGGHGCGLAGPAGPGGIGAVGAAGPFPPGAPVVGGAAAMPMPMPMPVPPGFHAAAAIPAPPPPPPPPLAAFGVHGPDIPMDDMADEPDTPPAHPPLALDLPAIETLLAQSLLVKRTRLQNVVLSVFRPVKSCLALARRCYMNACLLWRMA